MYIYIYMCVCIYMYIYTNTHMHTRTIYAHTYSSERIILINQANIRSYIMHTYVQCLAERTQKGVHIHTHVHICIHTYIHPSIQTYIHTYSDERIRSSG